MADSLADSLAVGMDRSRCIVGAGILAVVDKGPPMTVQVQCPMEDSRLPKQGLDSNCWSGLRMGWRRNKRRHGPSSSGAGAVGAGVGSDESEGEEWDSLVGEEW